MNMNKRNVIIKAAVASALLAMGNVASAGTLTAANTSFAVQNFGASFAATTAVVPGTISYSFSSATNVNPGAIIYFVVRLAGAKFNAAPANTTLTFAGYVPAAGASSTTSAGYVGTLSSDSTTLQVALTNGTATANLGLGAFTYTPGAGDIVGVGGLATAASTITATVAVTTASTSAAGMDSSNTMVTTVDSPTPTATMATSANAITGVVSSLPTYTNKIDLTATPVASDYSLRAVGVNDGMALGSVTFTTSTGKKNLGGAVDYTLESDSGTATSTATITVTPGSGQAFPVGSVVSYDVVSSGCIAGNQQGALAAITTATASTAKTLTVTAANVTTAIPIYVCMTKPSASNTAAPITVTISGSTVPGTGVTNAAVTASGSGYAVVYNGSQIDIRNYVPVAVTGYTNYLRVINTGSISAAVTAAVIDEVTGVVGTAGTLITTLAAGAAKTLSPTEVEAAIGTQPASARPRIRITAPTNGMNVQNFLFTPNGSFTEAGNAQ